MCNVDGSGSRNVAKISCILPMEMRHGTSAEDGVMMEMRDLGSLCGSATDLLCDLGQDIFLLFPLPPFVSLVYVKWQTCDTRTVYHRVRSL